MSPQISPVEHAARIAWKPQDLRTPWEWCEVYVEVDRTSPMPGPWRSANSPWVKELMEVAADRHVTFTAVKCSAQSSKTQTVLCLLFYQISEDPGPTMYVMANKDDAEDFVRDRFATSMKLCAPVREALVRETKLNFTFATMPLYFVGAGSKAKLQGKPIKRLLLDEVRNYPPKALDTVLKRVRAFDQSAQVLLISTPDMKKDAVDRAFADGDQRTYHFPCPACGHIQSLRLEQLRWDTNAETKPDGRWNFDKLAETIRYECEKCGHKIRDTLAERKAICRTGRFIRMNPNAPRHHVSFTWSALLPWWVRWRSIVEEFLKARSAARGGDLSPLKTFVNETLGESWDDELGVIDDWSFLEERKQNYGFDEPWSEEVVRFISADRQSAGGEHYFWVVRAFGLNARSRLVAYGRCNSRLELEDVRKQYRVKTLNAVIDSGDKANEVYRFCIATGGTNGWKAMKGDDPDFFLVKDQAGNTVRQCWQWSWAKPEGVTGAGGLQRIRLFRWSNPWVKDLLAEQMRGFIGEWTVSNLTGRDYFKMLSAEQRREFTDAFNRTFTKWVQVKKDNHWFDCECMITAAAVITGHLTAKPRPAPPAPKGG